MWSAIAALLSICGALLTHWYADNPTRKEKQADAQRQKMRQAINNGDADTVSRYIDRLRTASRQNRIHRGQQPGHTAEKRPGRAL